MINKTDEIYMYANAEDALETCVKQEEGFYETLQRGQNETSTKRNDNHATTGDTTPFVLACRKHAHSFLIAVLYVVVLFMICVYVYSEGKRKGVIEPVDLERNRTMDELYKQVENIELENSKLKRAITLLKEQQKNGYPDFRQQEELPKVAFTAKVGSKLKDLSDGAVIVFNSIVSNFGDCYNNETGYFTAPYNGVYVFYVTIMSVEDDNRLSYIETNILTQIGKEQMLKAKIYSGGYNSYDSSSNMVIIALKKGEYVFVAMNGKWSSNRSVYCCFSTFSGFLIAKDG